MPLIGNTSSNTSERMDNKTTAFAQKFTSPATFDPLKIISSIFDSWGAGGTAYFAIYSDNAGAVGTKLWQGQVNYSALVDGQIEAAIAGLTLSNATDYWLVLLTNNPSGTHWIDVRTQTGSGQIKKWTEASPGTWTDDPTTSDDAAELMLIYATSEVEVTSERDARLTGAVNVNSERDAFTAGGDGRYVEHFTNTDKKDAVNTDASWPGDGTARLSDT